MKKLDAFLIISTNPRHYSTGDPIEDCFIGEIILAESEEHAKNEVILNGSTKILSCDKLINNGNTGKNFILANDANWKTLLLKLVK